MAERTLFDLPNAPEEFGVLLEPASLRRLDLSALEFSTLRRVGIEYIRTYFKDQFNDFVAHNGIIMLYELLSYIGGNISMRQDILNNASFLPTADDEEAVSQHLKLITQRILRAMPATVDVEVSIPISVLTSTIITTPVVFQLVGPDNQTIFYELFRVPGDWTSPIEIPPGKRGVVAFGIEGRFGDSIVVVSSGGPDQVIEIPFPDVLDEPIIVEVRSGDQIEQWTRVEVKEKSNPNDKVYEVNFTESSAFIIFGDDSAGAAPLAGQEFTVRYRRGGGIRGRIQSGAINQSRVVTPQPPVSAPIEVRYRNITPSRGGLDKESIEAAKKRAPRDFGTHGNIVGGRDYGHVAETFSHPVYGSVFKAVATLRSSINANLVEIYVLQVGEGDVPVTPSRGLKDGLATFISEKNVFTDSVKILDGAVKRVDVEANIVFDRNIDASVAKENVLAVIDNFFDSTNFDIGQGFSLSGLYHAIQDVEGVKFVDIFKPADSILPTKKIADPGSAGIGFNELIVLGEKRLQFFFDKGGSER